MSMSLTISQPAKVEFGSRVAHDFSPRIQLAKSRLSPQPRVDSPLSSLRVGNSNSNSAAAAAAPATVHINKPADCTNMTTPHRGLPPPSAMTLPDPGRPPPSFPHSLGPLPAPPSQWSDHEESMRNWLAAKAEEDKRRQEEERTKQESFKLDQRKIEQSMLREALQGGVPPTMVPMIYAGIGGSNLANYNLELLQQYAQQLQAAQQQMQMHQISPTDYRKGEPRLLAQPASSQFPTPPSQGHYQFVPSQPVEPSQQPGAVQATFSAYPPPHSRLQSNSTPRSATHTQLPRLTTNEIFAQPAQQGPGSAHPLQQSQTVQEQPNSSPNIYFHHWHPPNEMKSNQPQTPASKGEPHSAHPSGSLISESDYKESPRKRKAQGQHHAAPPPSSAPSYTSPPFSTTSSASGRKVSHFRSGSGTDKSSSRPQSRRGPEPPRSTYPEPAEQSDERQSLRQEDSTGQSSTEARPETRDGFRPESRGSQ